MNAQVHEPSAVPVGSPVDPPGAKAPAAPSRQDRELLAALERFASGEWTWDELERRTRAHVLERLAEERTAVVGDERPVTIVAARRRLAEEWDALDEERRRRLLEGLVREIVVTEERIEIVALASAPGGGV
jgi:hypothetical protein